MAPPSARRVLLWITGASSGLGASLAATQPFGDAHVVDISRSGGTSGTEHLPADLADPATWGAVEAHLHARIGNFSGERCVFVHAAGTISPTGFAGEVDSLAYRREILLNTASGPVLGQSFLAALTAASFPGRADLVMITSGAASRPYAGWSGYGTGKAALDQWVRTVGEEQSLRGNPWRVVSIAPGVVDTGMQAIIREADERDFPAVGRFRDLHASGKLVSPEAAARGIWEVVESAVENGAVTDLRSQ